MTKVLLILMTVVLWSGCSDPFGVGSIFDESGWSPSTGPEGQPLELYQGKDSAGNRIDYQFYVSGADTIKHGSYHVYFENGDTSYSIGFKNGQRHGYSVTYGTGDTDYYREDKCVNYKHDALSSRVKCEGDEYADY